MCLVEMRTGQQGPLHVFDVEQIWLVLEGKVEIAVDASPRQLGSGTEIRVRA